MGHFYKGNHYSTKSNLGPNEQFGENDGSDFQELALKLEANKQNIEPEAQSNNVSEQNIIYENKENQPVNNTTQSLKRNNNNFKILNLGIVGVLVPTKNETRVNDEIKKLSGKLYWLPWGYRFGTLTKVCQYLYKQGYWTCNSKTNKDGVHYFIYSSVPQMRVPLIFFHHDSKNQGGNGLIYYKYEIDKVIIGKEAAIQIDVTNLPYEPLEPISKVWYGISRVCPLEREGVDFGTFDIHPDITGKPQRKVDKAKDAAFLYYQVLPVIEPYHNENDKSCNCLICR